MNDPREQYRRAVLSKAFWINSGSQPIVNSLEWGLNDLVSLEVGDSTFCHPHIEVLVIILPFAICEVWPILIDPRSYVDIFFTTTFMKIDLRPGAIDPFTNFVVGFNGEEVYEQER